MFNWPWNIMHCIFKKIIITHGWHCFHFDRNAEIFFWTTKQNLMLYLKTWIKDWKGYSHISTELPWNHAIKLTYGRLSRKRTAWRSNLSGRGYKDSHFLRLCLFSLEGDLCTNTQRNTQNKIKLMDYFLYLMVVNKSYLKNKVDNLAPSNTNVVKFISICSRWKTYDTI